MDPVVADMVAGYDHSGHGICDWTCRMIHQYIEVRSAWHDAGGESADLPLRLTADARLLPAACGTCGTPWGEHDEQCA